MYRSIKKYLFWLILCACIFSFFNRNTARNVNEILPEVLNNPVLKEINSKYSIELNSMGFRYALTPTYECEISGLIVDKLMYGPIIVNKQNGLDMNRNFTIMWGSNIGNETYKNKAIKFSGGEVSWEGSTAINLDKLARISLITKDENLWNRIKGVSVGDQIKVIGKLVNGSADRIIPVSYCDNHLEWQTGMPGNNKQFWSICVEDLHILKKANVFFNYLFWGSISALIALVAIHFLFPLKKCE